MAELKPFEIQRFGGWVQKADPLEIGWTAATDLSNVTLDNDGRLGTRPGKSLVDTGPTGTKQLFSFGDTTNYDSDLLIFRIDGGGSPIAALYNADSNTTYATALGDSDSTVTDYAQVGTPSASKVFFALSNHRLMSWTVGGADIANATTNTRPQFLDKWAASNRLAIANFSTASYAPGGSGGSPSTVWFSSATDPDSFDANDYVNLTPGDGEQITGVVAFRSFLLVFKQTKMFAFYGEATTETGNAEFLRRPVELPCRVGSNGNLNYAVGNDGVYFEGDDGIYVTDGGAPVSITAETFDPQWWLDVSSLSGMAFCRGQLFIDMVDPDNSTATVLVYDVRDGYWLKWTGLGVSQYNALSSLVNVDGVLHFLGGTGSKDVYKIDPDATTDYDGVAIAATYYTGKQQVSTTGAEGVVREVLLDGTGTLTCNLQVDGTNQTSASVTPTTASIGRYRKTARGRTFQLRLSSSSGAWELSRVVANVLPGRPTGAS